MNLVLLVLLFSYSQWKYRVDSICSPRRGYTESLIDRPYFSPPMNKSVPMLQNRRQRLYCCLYGVKISWTFRKEKPLINQTIIMPENKLYKLLSNNRKLEILKPNPKRDTGFYRCQGYNDHGEGLFGETFVTVFLSRSELNFKLLGWSNTGQEAFDLKSTHTLFCILSVHKSFSPNFFWHRIINSKIIPIINGRFLNNYRNRSTLVKGYEGYAVWTRWNYTKGIFQYNFTLTLVNIQDYHAGLYSCQINHGGKPISHNIQLYIHKRGEIPIYVLIGILGWCLASALSLYLFIYDIKLLIKNAIIFFFFGRNSSKGYDFFFIYNFGDGNELQNIKNIVKNIEARGYVCYFHHRDQPYGKDTLNTFQGYLDASKVVVIWTSSLLIKDPLSMACLNLLNYSGDTKRAYILTESKRQILVNSDSKSVINDLNSCYTPKAFRFDASKPFTSTQATVLTRWRKRRLISWIISRLPVKQREPGPQNANSIDKC